MNSKLESVGNDMAIEERYAEITTIPTLIKLFAIKMVAKSSFGFLRRFFISLFSKLSNSAGVSEKYATSAPEINAENINNNTIAIKLSKTSTLNK